MELDFERCYRAVDSRDQRFDGWFYTGVRTTGIYCRPSCPASTPKPANVAFYRSAAAAQRAGLRACRRCRPDAAPGSPEWDVRADVVGRAVRLIGDGVVDRGGVPGLAARLGYTERHLNRLLTAELGAGPLALARAQRAQTARILVESTELGLADVAFAAGFGSVRQFNDTIRAVYGCAPSVLRHRRPAAAGTTGAGTLHLRLAYRPPMHAPLDFLARRAIPGVEECDGRTYRRALRLPHGPATIALTPTDRCVEATLQLTDLRDLAPAVSRSRRLLDLDADPTAVDAALSEDPALSPTVRAEPGVRVPRCVDGFEMAVRAIIGQQVAVASARTTLAHLVASVDHGVTDTERPGHGTQPHDRPKELRGFPTAEEVLRVADGGFRMPGGRREAVRGVARAVVCGELDLAAGADPGAAFAGLCAVGGVGPWTAGYVVMRALGDPDVFLPTDLAARRGARKLGIGGDLGAHAERWRPWRSYALVRLWRNA